MKYITSVLLCLSLILTSSCGSTGPKRIVSETPIKTTVLGLPLCSRASESSIRTAISKETNLYVYSEKKLYDGGPIVRIAPTSYFNYGGLAWHYIDVNLSKDNLIVAVAISASYESIEMAKKQFLDATQIFTRKYGSGNHKGEQIVFWTDNTNSVGLSYEESSTIAGDTRSFCTLYYVNVALSDEWDKNNVPDV